MKSIVILVCIFLCACTTPMNTNYLGPDHGDLVYSNGIIGDTYGIGGFAKNFRFQIHYRKAGAGTDHDGIMEFYSDWLTSSHMDFTGDEIGGVNIKHLEPGNYEIYTFQLFEGKTIWTPKQTFSIPFTIEPGKATYIGDYDGVEAAGHNILGWTVGGGGYIAVSDQHERDLEIARKTEPNLPPVVLSVFDVSSLYDPLIRPR